MTAKIRFCEHNKGKGKVVRKLEEEFPDADIKVKKCVKQCGVCRELPMAVVNKVRVTGTDGDDLYQKITKQLQAAQEPA